MGIVLDASVTLAWLIERVDAAEVHLTNEILRQIQAQDAIVPSLWFLEVSNGILMAERRGVVTPAQSVRFLGMVDTLPIEEDRTQSALVQATALTLARACGLTAYDATYLELTVRTRRTLATFDRQLADATRKAGGRVFGDRP
ncbi:MAG TPA: type II toxin-antitoxin system VapC family toxin [Terracidiphilus sp.]|nr:type II toxin-antitoxin system VapC family toxin [Terracidiphilus sp.]